MSALLKHYRKDLLRPGTFTDERGRVVSYTPDVVRAAAAATAEAIGDGVRIPVVVGDAHPTDIHESTPGLDGRPEVKGFVDMTTYSGGWLKADIDARGAELPNTDVSVWIEPSVEVNGKRYAPFIRHVLLTDAPAVKGQAPMALLRSPASGDEKKVAIILTSQAGSEREQAMDPAKLLGTIRAKLKLPETADEAAILGGIDKLSQPAAPPALLSGVRTKLGLAADAKDEDVIAKLDELAKAKPAEKEPELPAALLKAQREIASDRLQIARERFKSAVEDLASPAAMKITPAVRDRVLKQFPTEPSSPGALLSEPKYDEVSVRQLLLDVLGDLPAKNVVASGKLHIVPGDKQPDAAGEAKKTLVAAGLAS